MKDFRPLFVQNMNVNCGPYRPLQLQVNRHLRELTNIQAHQHPFHQVLLYLTGKGVQRFDSGSQVVAAGSVCFFAAGQLHSFEETSTSRPICLVLDLHWDDAPQASMIRRLPSQQLAEARTVLSAMMRHHDPGNAANTLRLGAGVLHIMDIMLRGLGFITSSGSHLPSPVVRAVKRTLADPASQQQSLSKIARRVGYQHDYLNRLLKQSTGMTLGQVRSDQRMQQAQRLLMQAAPVHEVATRTGFEDPNYFSRWFKQQTGTSPLQWRKLKTSGGKTSAPRS